MARLRVKGNRFSINSIVGITLIVVAIVSIAAIVVAAVVLPKYAEVNDYTAPEIVSIVMPNNGMISVDADYSQVYAIVKYSNGESKNVALSEMIRTGLDTTKEGTCENVVLNFGGYEQIVDFRVVPTELVVEYVASTGGRIEGESVQSVTAGENATRVEAIADEGYYFAGWSDGNINASRLDTQISKSEKLIATFQKLEYSVVFFYPDGTTAREQMVKHNEAPMYVPGADEKNMELYGYKFSGWDTDFSHITQDTNIHPEFEKFSADFNIEYTVDKSGRPLGTSDAFAYYEYDELATVRITPNAERMFVGWSVYNVDQQVWVDIAPVEEGRLVNIASGYSVEFVSERTSNSDTYVLSFTPPSRPYEEGDDYDIKVKAHFVYLESEISFTSMNNKVFDRFVIDHDTPIGEKFDVEDLTKLSTHGYSFKGWYVEGSAFGEDGKPEFVTNETKFTQPTELVAYWEKEIFTAVFLKGENEDVEFTDVANGYDAAEGGQVITAYYQDTIAGALTGAFPEATPIKANHTFKGWYLADADRLPTATVVDRTFKLQEKKSLFVPVFEVNTKSLVVSMSGSGTIATLVYDAEYDEYSEKTINGKINMPVTENYGIRIRPSQGYALVSVTVNGATTENLAIEDYYDITIESIISTDYTVKAVFKLTEYVISIANGTEFTPQGNLVYGVLGETATQSTSDIAPTPKVNYGSGFSLEINPQTGFYISGLTVNGADVALPTECTYYNLILENVTQANSIVITYREFIFTMTIPASSSKGEMIADEKLVFESGEIAKFTVLAKEGYYIRSLTANGTVIDPYATPDNYQITELKINGETVSTLARSDVRDYRVTTLKFEITSITQNIDFDVEYDSLYYNVTTHYEGIGTVDAPFTVLYGDSFQVNGSTSGGYFVHSVIVNGEENSYHGVLTSRNYTVNGVNKDYDIKFIFKRTVYYVNFLDTSNTSATIIYNEETIHLPKDKGYTVNGIEHATSASFKIIAPNGYYIKAINVKPNNGKPDKDESINYSVSEYDLTISNVSASYDVYIECEAITVDYNIYFINKGTNNVNINNQLVEGDFYSAQIAYGSDISATIQLQDDYALEIDNITIKNQDDRATIEYLALNANVIEDPDKSYYALIRDRTDDVTLNVIRVKSEIDVYVYFANTTGNSTISFASSENGTLTASNTLGEVLSGSSQVEGAKVTFTATANAGYLLETFMVNGVEIDLNELNQGKYEVTVGADTFVYASFSKTQYKVTIESGVKNGVVATDKTIVTSGENLAIKLTPVEGYEVSLLEIVVSGSDIIYQPLNTGNYTAENGMIECKFEADKISGDISIKASFAPITYDFTYTHTKDGRLEGVGDGGHTKVSYGSRLDVKIIANEGFYISAINLNGESVSPQTLSGEPNIRVTGEYLEGTLRVNIVGNTTLDVTFSPLVYSITVSESLGGETLINNYTKNSGYIPANQQILSAGDNLAILAVAKEGYHVEEVRINGIPIEFGQFANMSKNDISELRFDYKSASVLTVSDNIVVRVIYAVNEYQIKINVINNSPNFKNVDLDPNTFGTVSITGYTAGENNIYTGFTHGSKVKFVVTPRTARGYYISRFELVYFKDGEEIPPVVIPSSVLAETGGSYIMQEGITSDIQEVRVEFSRRVYEYSELIRVENLGSTRTCEGVIEATFTNPYSSQPIVLVEGKYYEHGLNFNVNVNPKSGYTRTAFTVNGENRLNAVRNNAYIGTVTGDMNLEVEYTINTFTVNMSAIGSGTYYIYDPASYDENNGRYTRLLWAPDVNIYETEEEEKAEEDKNRWDYILGALSISTGYVWATEQGLTVTYGTEILIVSIPDTAAGFRTQSFYINGVSRPIVDEDASMMVVNAVQTDIEIEVAFTIHTYRVEVNVFEGGVAQVSSSVVNWQSPVTITLEINKGYQLESAIVYEDGVATTDYKTGLSDANGENGGSVNRAVVEHNLYIEITLKHKPYDVTFTGDYKTEYNIDTAKSEVKAEIGVILNQNSSLKEEKQYGLSDLTLETSGNGVLKGLASYADKMTVLLTSPIGYRITTVYITMDDNGSGTAISNLVLKESDLDADDGSGVRTYTIQNLTGNVTVHVEYAIKQYRVIYQHRSGGSYYSTGTTLVSHHDLFSVVMFSDAGYYLSNLDINGRSIATTYEKDDTGMGYKYSSDTRNTSGGLTLLNIDDVLVNGQDTITITPAYEKQRFEVVFYVGTEQVTSVSQNDIYQKYGIKLSIENNEIIYDALKPAVITQELVEGFSITSVSIYNRPSNQGPDIYSFATAGRDYNIFTAKGNTLSVTLDREIFAIMDYHSTNSRIMRFYYTTARDVHSSESSMYLVTSKTENGTLVNYGSEIVTAPSRAFNMLATFSDGQTSKEHDYGTEAILSVAVTNPQDYSFQGFQELINSVWTYCVNGVNGVTIQSGGTELRYTMTANREFRAVFFRLYEIEVQIHPEYKYVAGTFRDSIPSAMRYRKYASITASATYVQDGTGVILPNVPSSGSTVQEYLKDIDGDDTNASYTYRVLSGARLVFLAADSRPSENPSNLLDQEYVIVEEDGRTIEQTPARYNSGVATLVDRVIHAYFMNDLYVSFAMETLGSETAGEGGSVRYNVNGANAGSLSNNSLIMSPNDTLTITIEPNKNFRYIGIKQLEPLQEADADGYRQFMSTYTPLEATPDGKVEITETARGGAIITLRNLNENSIFKIEFVKQILVTSSVSVITDETTANGLKPKYEITYKDSSSASNVLYDYNAEVQYDLSFSMGATQLDKFKRAYQFVGYFINGINTYTQLIQNYPNNYNTSFILNNLDGLSNGVNIVERKENDGTVNYCVDIVAKFVPVYNVVIENEYLDSGAYLDPGQISASTVMYDPELTQYFISSANVQPKLGADKEFNTDTVFQMLGKINTIADEDKNEANSQYNTWLDNMITLTWGGALGSQDSFAFVAWQYYAYDASSKTFEWRNIPYKDTDETNSVSNKTFTFPISCLFSTTYPAVIGFGGEVDSRYCFDASQYDYNGQYLSSKNIPAIRIRPKFQKVETLEIIKSTAMDTPDIFLDGQGDVEPQINGYAESSGEFHYYTVQTLLPLERSGYEFVGWYITENGQGGHQPLTLTANRDNAALSPVINGTTYYFQKEEILDTDDHGTGTYITYNYNTSNKQLEVLMDGSFKIFARYVRIYTITVNVTNISGYSPMLSEALPTINYYKKVNDVWTLQTDSQYVGKTRITITDARVGTSVLFTLNTNFTGIANDAVNFNPIYDRFDSITSVDENNRNVWNANGSEDYKLSYIPVGLDKLASTDATTVSNYNAQINDDKNGIFDDDKHLYAEITANAQKTVTFNFRSYGTLVLHNVYQGSSIRLPSVLGEALANIDSSLVEQTINRRNEEVYYVKDGATGNGFGVDGDGVLDGNITIYNIPIRETVSYDGEISGDYATRLIDTADILASDSISIGINFAGADIRSKVQHVAYYGTAEWTEYKWDGGTLKEETVSATSRYVKPFASGSGTEVDPFIITTIEHLRNVDGLYRGNYGSLAYNNNTARVHFKQMANICLSQENNFLIEPLCLPFTDENGVYRANGFNGIYDGNGYYLYDLQFNLNNSNITENVGIFSKVYLGGVIKNVNLGRANINSNATNVGILVGAVVGGTVYNVKYDHAFALDSDNITNTIIGQNAVGGLIGMVSGEDNQYGIIENSSISDMTVRARIGGEFAGIGSDYTGGAGGLVGVVGQYGLIRGMNGGYTVKSTIVLTAIGAGGIAGTTLATQADKAHNAIENVLALDVSLTSTDSIHMTAIGGIVGSNGAFRTISNADYKVEAIQAVVSSSRAEAGFSLDAVANYSQYGAGGIAGYNNGTITGADVTTTGEWLLQLKGSMVGGLVGVNLGTLTSSTVKGRLYSSRQKTTAHEGGLYGAITGYNQGTVTNVSAQGLNTATNDYVRSTALYEVVTSGNSVYEPVSGPNAGMHGDAGSDTTSVFVGGLAAYNAGTVSGTIDGKIMVNRRSNDAQSNNTYIALGAAYSTNTNITLTGTGTSYIRFMHYIFVDPNDDARKTAYAYIGKTRGNGTGGTASVSLTADAMYIGGGTVYNSASFEAGFTWGYAGTGYMSGVADITFYGVNNANAESYAPNWNGEDVIKNSADDSRVYAVNCEKTGGDAGSLWKSAWNYTGYLRFIDVVRHDA